MGTRFGGHLQHGLQSSYSSDAFEHNSPSNPIDPMEFEWPSSESDEQLGGRTKTIVCYFSRVGTLDDDRTKNQNVCRDSSTACKPNKRLTVARCSTSSGWDSCLIAKERGFLVASPTDPESSPVGHSCVVVRYGSLMEARILARRSIRLWRSRVEPFQSIITDRSLPSERIHSEKRTDNPGFDWCNSSLSSMQIHHHQHEIWCIHAW